VGTFPTSRPGVPTNGDIERSCSLRSEVVRVGRLRASPHDPPRALGPGNPVRESRSLTVADSATPTLAAGVSAPPSATDLAYSPISRVRSGGGWGRDRRSPSRICLTTSSIRALPGPKRMASIVGRTGRGINGPRSRRKPHRWARPFALVRRASRMIPLCSRGCGGRRGGTLPHTTNVNAPPEREREPLLGTSTGSPRSKPSARWRASRRRRARPCCSTWPSGA
jgi:hypothetical protein